MLAKCREERQRRIRADGIAQYIHMPMLAELGIIPSRRYARGAEILEHCPTGCHALGPTTGIRRHSRRSAGRRHRIRRSAEGRGRRYCDTRLRRHGSRFCGFPGFGRYGGPRAQRHGWLGAIRSPVRVAGNLARVSGFHRTTGRVVLCGGGRGCKLAIHQMRLRTPLGEVARSDSHCRRPLPLLLE
jgi:hypothetical protein